MFSYILIGVLTITSYQSTPEQTKGKGAPLADCFYTSISHRVSEDSCAVSRDLLDAGIIQYGDVVFVEGLKPRIVNDTMNPRIKRTLDFWVPDLETEKKFGVKHRRVWIVRREITGGGNDIEAKKATKGYEEAGIKNKVVGSNYGE